MFGILALLAAIPSASVALVVTRSATSGVGNGVAVAAGIVLGDLVFILLTLLGLSVVAESMGNLFAAIKILGATYLVWLGFSLLKTSKNRYLSVKSAESKGGLCMSFLVGFALTLGDIKAVLFYVSLFPMFVDMTALQTADMFVIMLVTILSVGGVKIIYALSAAKIASLAQGLHLAHLARKVAGGVMLGVGGFIIAKSLTTS